MKPKIKLFIFLLIGVFIAGGFSSGVFGVDALSDHSFQVDNEKEMVEVVIRLKPVESGSIIQARSVGGRGGAVNTMKSRVGSSQSSLKRDLLSRGAEVKKEFWIANALLVEVKVSDLEQIKQRDDVERVHENFKIEAFRDTSANKEVEAQAGGDYTWGLERINVPQVWEMGISGTEGVKVVVLDTGIDITHADLTGKLYTSDVGDDTYPGGWAEFDSGGNVVGSKPHETYTGTGPNDNSGHGTHVSGTVAGGNNSGTYIGVAPDTDLAHGLVIPEGGGSFAQVIAGMEWAVDGAGANADVVNMSFGVSGYVKDMEEPVMNIINAGAVPVAAIGNDGHGTGVSPGLIYEAFAVGALDSNDNIASFSGGSIVEDGRNKTPSQYIKPDFAAPGVNIKSAVPDENPKEYDEWDGTSMAAPHIAGVIALILEVDNTLTVAEIDDALKNTAEYYEAGSTLEDGEEKNTRYGYGVIDAHAAVRSLQPIFTLPLQTVTHNSATLRGDLTINEEKDVFFNYRKSIDTDWQTIDEGDRITLTEEGTYEIEVTGLTESTTYEYRAIGENETIEGEIMEFTTKETPQVSTLDATGVSGDTATLNGEITSLGDEASVDVFFRYRVQNGEWVETEEKQTISEAGTFNEDIINLQSNENYEYKAVVEWNGYEDTGEMNTFFTENYPEVKTDEADDIGYTEANLHGELTSLGDQAEVNVSFEHRKSGESTWNSTTSVVKSVVGSFNEGITGLTEGTEYEYRAVVEWSENEGTKQNLGEVVSFKTVSHPTVETKDAIDVDYTSATLKGELVEIGLEEEGGVKVYFEYKKGEEAWASTDKEIRNITGEFGETISNLDENVEYKFRAVVEWNDGADRSVGGEVMLTTKKKPTVRTDPPVVSHHNKAVLKGELVSIGLETVSLYFQYKKNDDSWDIATEVEVET